MAIWIRDDNSIFEMGSNQLLAFSLTVETFAFPKKRRLTEFLAMPLNITI
jgi:hypothetical protein